MCKALCHYYTKDSSIQGFRYIDSSICALSDAICDGGGQIKQDLYEHLYGGVQNEKCQALSLNLNSVRGLEGFTPRMDTLPD